MTGNKIIGIVVLTGMLLTACGGALPATSWPNATLGEDTLMVSNNTAIYALSPENGMLRWQFPHEGKGDRTTNQLYSAPAENGNLALAGSDNKHAFALSVETGEELWRFDATGNKSGTAPTAVGASSKMLFFAADDTLYALQPSSGLPAWTVEADGEIWAAPATDNERVYLPSMDHHITALDMQSGAKLWQTKLDGALADTPTLADGMLYVGALAQHAYAIDSMTGLVKWRFDTDGWVWGSPTVSDNSVYFADLDGNVYALDAVNGRSYWRSQQLDSSVRGSPAIDNDIIFIVTDGGYLYALNARNGNQIWELQVDANNADRLLADPIARDGLVYVTAMNGESLMMAYHQESGQLAWQFQPDS